MRAGGSIPEEQREVDEVVTEVDGNDEVRADRAAADLGPVPADALTSDDDTDGQAGSAGPPPPAVSPPGADAQPPAGPSSPPSAGPPSPPSSPLTPPAPPLPHTAATAALSAAISGRGRPLPPRLRRWAQDRTGADLGGVRLHEGPDAHAAAAQMSARALTVGQHIVLGDAMPPPASPRGHPVLVHELGHVLAPSRHAAVGRDPLAPAVAPTGPALPASFEPYWPGEDPAAVVAETSQLVEALNTVQLGPRALAEGVPAAIVHPHNVALHAENVVIVLDSTGRTVVAVTDRDTSTAPMVERALVVLMQESTGRIWLVGQQDGNIRIEPVPLAGQAQPEQPASASLLIAYMPGVTVSPELVTSLRRRARGAAGTEAEAPTWAGNAVRALRRRRTTRAGGAGTIGQGPGAGAQGTGRGGGGDAERFTGSGAGSAAHTPTPTSPAPTTDTPTVTTRTTTTPDSRPPAPPSVPSPTPAKHQNPLRGPATYTTQVSRTGQPQVRITIDRANTTIDLHDGETPTELEARVDRAEADLQLSRDPTPGIRPLHPHPSAFVPPPSGTRSTGSVVPVEQAQAQARSSSTAVTPGERVPGAPGGANAPQYRSEIAMAGIDVQVPAVSVSGATNRFTMTLDYAAMSAGMQDEVFNRMQPIQFFWELIDVTGLTRANADAVAARTRTGGGDVQGALSGAGGDIRRTGRNIARDQEADLAMMAEEDWPWAARSAYLGIIGLSNTVRMLGSLIGSYIDVITQPLNERSISFDRDGDFLVRCVATPQVSDEAKADPDHHVLRASSVAVMPVRVSNIGARANEAVDAEQAALSALEARLQAAEARGDTATAAALRARLGAARRASTSSAMQSFSDTLTTLRQQVATGERLERHLSANVPDALWDVDEVNLQTALITRQQTIWDFLSAARGQLRQFAGKDGAHEQWVTAQHARIRPVEGHTDFRPRVALASEENGQVTEVRCMLGRTNEGLSPREWVLIDITSPGTRDRYTGSSPLPGIAGDAAAIRDTFRNFAENAGYGRGSIAVRLPPDLIDAIHFPLQIETMVSAPGAGGRALQRLRDLATVAEIAGMFATGGLAVAIGAVGGVAGAVLAVDSLLRRSRTRHLWEPRTIADVLGVVGGITAGMSVGTHLAREVAGASLAAGRMPSWFGRLEATERALHVHATFGMVQQVVTIPMELVNEWAEIDALHLPEGEANSRRARALLHAARGVFVTTVQMRGGIRAETEPTTPGTTPEGETPATRPAGPARPPETALPPGTRRPDAEALAAGTGPPRRPLTGPAAEAAPAGTTPTETAPSETAPARTAPYAADPGTSSAGEPPAPRAVRLGEPLADTSPDALVARARRMAVEQVRAADEVTARRRADAEAHEESERRTAVGTVRRPPPRAPGEPIANAAGRGRAVELLNERFGTDRPAAPPAAEGNRPRGPGAYEGRTTSADEALASFDRACAAAPGTEVGLFFNAITGEFAVQVGTESQVRPPHGDGWQAMVHVHPTPGNVIVHRLPAPADVALAARAALNTGSHTEFVQSTRPDGTTGLSRVTVTTNPWRIVVEMPASGIEPGHRIDVTSPEAYAREWGSQTTYLDPSDPQYAWVQRDLDDFYRIRRQDAGDTRTVMGTGGVAPEPISPPNRVATAAEAQSMAAIQRMRGRLYEWRRTATGDPEVAALVEAHLADLRRLAGEVRRGVPVEGELQGLDQTLRSDRRVIRPVRDAHVTALARGARRKAARATDPAVQEELTRIADAADRLAARVRAGRGPDPRIELDTLRRQARRAERQDFELHLELDTSGQRAEVMTWLEDAVVPLTADPAGEYLAREILRQVEAADSLVMQQSPRGAGEHVAATSSMRRNVRAAVVAGRYSAEYRALFEQAASGHEDGWPRTPDGRVWEVDHVTELWLGGADDITNYLALPAPVHELKSSILTRFRQEFRPRAEPGEQTDMRATDPTEPAPEATTRPPPPAGP